MLRMKPFRFAVQAHTAADAKSWREQARTVESLGYSTLFMPDHFGDQWRRSALTVAAEATTTLSVGALVFDNDYSHPACWPRKRPRSTSLSEGRFEFGLGAGLDEDRLRASRASPTTRPASASTAWSRASRS